MIERGHTDFVMSKMEPILKSILSHSVELNVLTRELPWDSPQFYGIWLGQMRLLVEETVPMFKLAAAKCARRDPAIYQYIINHAVDAFDQEAKISQDIKRVGFYTDKLAQFHETKQIFRSQYYFIHEVEPLCFIGDTLYFESMSSVIGKEILSRLVKVHGAISCSFLIAHTQVCKIHSEHITKVLDMVDPGRLMKIHESINCTHKLFVEMLKKCKNDWQLSTRNVSKQKRIAE